VQRHAVVEFERDHLAQALGGVDLRHAAVERDPVLEVDDEVALHQLGEIEQLVDLRDGDAGPARAGGRLGLLRPKTSVSVTKDEARAARAAIAERRPGARVPP
jgi:hypothetical protein